MTTITHQDIIDRREAIGRDHSKAYAAEQARIRKEYSSLEELCGGLGHVYARDLSFAMGPTRFCVFCKKMEA